MTQDTEFDSLAQAIAASSLVSPEDWSSVSTIAGGDGNRLKDLLVTRGLLTRFQVDAFAEGRASSLRVGNYDVLDRLGAGGMGTVFKARHRRMKRLVALKLLAQNLSTNPVFVKRFQREVETIACLGHPNVVMAYDADEADAGHFLVMEFVNGRDLAASVAKDGPMPLPKAVDCILQAARGLAYAHSQDIIHRDIKPHNLLIDDNGIVKITDLGLARLQHDAEGGGRSDVTAAGVVVGTADFMPPEQAFDPDTIDSRADIYSLGCTLYYLLAGKPPYTGVSIVAILMKHRDAEIPALSGIGPDVPARLETLFRRMLAKQPADRIGQMSEVVAELEAIAREVGAPPRAGAAPAVGPSARSLEFSVGPVAQSNTTPVSSSVTAPIGAQTVELASLSGQLHAPAAGQIGGILIVEPSRVQASIIKGYLQEQAHSVVATVANGREAIDAIRRLQPRAVVSTLHMSDWNGLQLAEQIRAEIRPAPPGFVLVTSEAIEGEAEALSRLNRVVLLRKPFNSAQLNDALSQVIGATAEHPVTSGASAAPVDPGVTGEMPRPITDRSRLRVLVVDDSATARANIRMVLQGLGVTQFLEVTDGAYAIAAAAREICDLIVTDYNMPLMDGRALVSYLKQNPATSAIPIVMVTTETDPKILDPVRRLGVVAILEKAFPASVVGPLLASLFG